MVREDLRMLEQRDREDKTKLQWLRAAAKEGFNSIDRGENLEFETVDDLEDYVHQVGREVSAQVATRRKRG